MRWAILSVFLLSISTSAQKHPDSDVDVVPNPLSLHPSEIKAIDHLKASIKEGETRKQMQMLYDAMQAVVDSYEHDSQATLKTIRDAISQKKNLIASYRSTLKLGELAQGTDALKEKVDQLEAQQARIAALDQQIAQLKKKLIHELPEEAIRTIHQVFRSPEELFYEFNCTLNVTESEGKAFRPYRDTLKFPFTLRSTPMQPLVKSQAGLESDSKGPLLLSSKPFSQIGKLENIQGDLQIIAEDVNGFRFSTFRASKIEFVPSHKKLEIRVNGKPVSQLKTSTTDEPLVYVSEYDGIDAFEVPQELADGFDLLFLGKLNVDAITQCEETQMSKNVRKNFRTAHEALRKHPEYKALFTEESTGSRGFIPTRVPWANPVPRSH